MGLMFGIDNSPLSAIILHLSFVKYYIKFFIILMQPFYPDNIFFYTLKGYPKSANSLRNFSTPVCMPTVLFRFPGLPTVFG